MSVKEIILGESSSFKAFPAEITVEHENYFLIQSEDSYKLFSSVCPHAGGPVIDNGSEFFCPFHMWTFEKATGECTTVRGASLTSYKVSEKDGKLIAFID